MRVLDVDIENRPLSYLGSDFTTGEVTAIAWGWEIGGKRSGLHVALLGYDKLPSILSGFVAAYNDADLVTGHYLKGHDLPMINGALMECGMPPLREKLVQDTKLDLIKTKGISLSQESLAAMLRLDAAKVHMTQHDWRQANRLTAQGLRLVRARVAGDVKQHMDLRRELLQRGYLCPPKMWSSGSSIEPYTP